MRITGSPNIQNAMLSYAKSVKKSEEVEKSGFKSDKVEISSEAKDYQLAMNALKEVPDIRTEKVEALKEEIKSGKFKANADQIAEHILKGLKE